MKKIHDLGFLKRFDELPDVEKKGVDFIKRIQAEMISMYGEAFCCTMPEDRVQAVTIGVRFFFFFFNQLSQPSFIT